jgi:hypothetical protein
LKLIAGNDHIYNQSSLSNLLVVLLESTFGLVFLVSKISERKKKGMYITERIKRQFLSNQFQNINLELY